MKSPKLEPAIIVIFGITGDLSKRKLLPALYHLIKDDLLHDRTVIVGISRKEIVANSLISDIELCVNEVDGVCDPVVVGKLRARLRFMQMDISSSDSYPNLLDELNKIESENALCMNRLYYLSVPPQVTGSIINDLGANGLNKSCEHNIAKTRLLIEKPFGYNYKSAEELIKTIRHNFSDDQVFRIDHYLAKETVQNILTFRFNNVFEDLWDKRNISHISITAAETIGIENRATFYEQVGALRDFIQSHLIQLLAVVILDLPKNLTSEEIHKAKLSLLKSIYPLPANKIDDYAVRGQYEGYKKEVSNPNSNVETFAAICLYSKNSRWKNVPFLLRTGKNMTEKLTEIKVFFKSKSIDEPGNILIFRIQPKEGIELKLLVKKPDFNHKLETAAMDFSYKLTFDDNGHPDAYERVLVDAVKGDHTLFSTSQEVMESWRIIEPLLKNWTDNKNISSYKKGSWGPESSEILAKRHKSSW
jgi:glucose-6-phosphate 1-dehydrogenase